MTSQVVWMDFRCNREYYTPQQLIELLKKEADEWVFQLEEGEETGYEHYQGRVRLVKKTRCDTWRKRCGLNYVAPTNANAIGNWEYVTKETTRIGGPWRWDDVNINMPRDVRKVKQLHPWQEQLKEIACIYEERQINVVIDTKGNNGKTLFTRWMMCNKLAQLIPFCNDFKDIMRMVMDMPKSPCYIMDMPRAIKKEKLYQLWSGIEMVKNGYAYDDRYAFKQEMFDPPVIIIFMNNEPDTTLLSRDRWTFWEIGDFLDLVKLDPSTVGVTKEKEEPKVLTKGWIDQMERTEAQGIHVGANAGKNPHVSNILLNSGSSGSEFISKRTTVGLEGFNPFGANN